MFKHIARTGFEKIKEDGLPANRIMWLLFSANVAWLEIALGVFSVVEFFQMQDIFYPAREAADHMTGKHGHLLAAAHLLFGILVLHETVYDSKRGSISHAAMLSAFASIWLVHSAFVWDAVRIDLINGAELYSTLLTAAFAAFVALRAVGSWSLEND